LTTFIFSSLYFSAINCSSTFKVTPGLKPTSKGYISYRESSTFTTKIEDGILVMLCSSSFPARHVVQYLAKQLKTSSLAGNELVPSMTKIWPKAVDLNQGAAEP